VFVSFVATVPARPEEAADLMIAKLARQEVARLPLLERARWHRLLGEACIQLGEMRPAREHLERTLSLLDSPVPASTPGWLEVLASQWLRRRLWSQWLDGRPGAARRAWARAIREAERLAMPYELARAHYELGRHLAVGGERATLGLDRAGHLEHARSTFQTLGCQADLAAAGLGRESPVDRRLESLQHGDEREVWEV
jgi:hypothetical protein